MMVIYLVKKLPGLYGTRRFITVFTKAASGPYLQPGQSSLHPQTRLFKDAL